MAVLTFSEIQNLAYDRAQINVATDAPIAAAEFVRIVNDAYAAMWEVSGGRIKVVASATAWTSAQTATGVVTGILTDIGEVTHVFASLTSGSTGTTAGDKELDRVEMSYIQYLRHGADGYGPYTTPKVYSVNRLATTTPASVNLVQLDYWPGTTGYYFPIHYVPQFTPIDASTVTTPDLNDIESRDLALHTGAVLAQLVGRPDLVPGIFADISSRTGRLILERRQSALIEGKQDK